MLEKFVRIGKLSWNPVKLVKRGKTLNFNGWNWENIKNEVKWNEEFKKIWKRNKFYNYYQISFQLFIKLDILVIISMANKINNPLQKIVWYSWPDARF